MSEGQQARSTATSADDQSVLGELHGGRNAADRSGGGRARR
jgi:hypothetical protein